MCAAVAFLRCEGEKKGGNSYQIASYPRIILFAFSVEKKANHYTLAEPLGQRGPAESVERVSSPSDTRFVVHSLQAKRRGEVTGVILIPHNVIISPCKLSKLGIKFGTTGGDTST